MNSNSWLLLFIYIYMFMAIVVSGLNIYHFYSNIYLYTPIHRKQSFYKNKNKIMDNQQKKMNG